MVKKKVRDIGIEINKKVESIKTFVFKTVEKTPTESAPRSVKDPSINAIVVKPIQHKIEFKLVKHAVNRVARQFLYEVGNEERDVSSFLNRAREGAIKILRENRNKKVYDVLTSEMECASILAEEVITRIVNFSSNSGIVLEPTDLGKFYNRAKETIMENMIKYNKMGSNCAVSAIVKMDINMIDYNPISAGSYIPLDPLLSSKKAIINIKNKDNQCFKCCVTRVLNMMPKNLERMDEDLKKQSTKLNWNGIDFPVLWPQIKKFEENNEDISIYVFGYDNKSIHPLWKSKYCDRKHIITLLLISNEETYH